MTTTSSPLNREIERPADNGRRSVVDVVVLCAAMGVAAWSTSAGSLAASVAIAWVLLRYGAAVFSRATNIDLLALVSAVVVLASPHWVPGQAPELASASYGPAISLLFFVVARRVLLDPQNLIRFVRGTALLTLAYAGYFLTTGQTLDVSNARRTVDFANANYTAAVLAFGVAASVWMVRGSARRSVRLFAFASVLIHAWAIIETGSRASLAGAALAATVIVLGPSVRAYRIVGVGMVAAFVVGFFPQFDELTVVVSAPLANLPFIGRSASAIGDASSRFELWHQARNVIGDSWLLGWGPDRYRFQPGGPENLAHSWGLEYMASVGLLGTVLLVAVIAMSYAAPYRAASRDGLLLTTASALALVPSLTLSTHQWTLWFWAAVAVWSRCTLAGVRSLTSLDGGSRPAELRTPPRRSGRAPRPARRAASPGVRRATTPRPD